MGAIFNILYGIKDIPMSLATKYIHIYVYKRINSSLYNYYIIIYYNYNNYKLIKYYTE